MNQINQLIARLSETEFSKRYPNLNLYDGKTHVLYLSPYLNGTGLYRSILPALHLNQHAGATHHAFVSEIRPWKISEASMLDQADFNLNDNLLKWADYVVFPTIISDIAPIVAQMKSINTKSNLQFVFDIDDCVHEIPAGHPMFNVYSNRDKTQLLKNMAACDVVTGTNNHLLSYYQEAVTEAGLKAPDFFLLPNLMSPLCYDDISANEKEAKEKTRIALIFNPGQFADVNPLRKVFSQLQEQRNDFEFILFGWNGSNRKTMHNCMNGIRHTYISPVPVTEYFKMINKINFDFAVMPLQENPFNRCKSHHKLLQYAWQGIPAIVSDIETYTDIIEENEDSKGKTIKAFVAQSNAEWLSYMNQLIDNKGGIRSQVAQYNSSMVRTHYSLHGEIDIWKECFC